MLFGEYSTHFIRHPFDVRMVIHPPGVPIPRLQVLFSLSVAIQRPLCTVQGGEVRVDIRPKERGDRGRSLPTTIRMTAGMFLDADGMIAKDGMKIGGFISVFR
jgi:hypothetical protein